jgi:molecular chaperone DnaJ
VDLEIPAGIFDGQRLRMAGRGHEGEPGAPAGDLLVRVAVADDDRFGRDGHDIVTRLDVTFVQAALGGTVTVPTLAGEEAVELPPGTQPGDVVTLRDRGMPVLGGRGRGDERVVVNVLVPRKLTAEQRSLLERFEDLAGGETYDADESLLSRLRSAFR